MNKLDLSLERMAPDRLEQINQLKVQHQKIIDDQAKLADILMKLDTVDIAAVSKRFFSNADKMAAKATTIKELCPKEKEHIIEICQNIQNHSFDMLGTGFLDYGQTINWHRDIAVGYEWPSDQEFVKMGAAAFDIIIDKNNTAELKAPWDLSNMHWIPSLVCGYYLTNDSSYIQTFVADTEDWLEHNPAFYGVNWFCPMNIAMRAINLIVGLTAFYPMLDSVFVRRLIDSLYLHGLVTMAYLEIEDHAKRNNHYLTNLVGMYFLGQFFKDLEFGQEWLEFAKNELELESSYQFYDDGVIFEDSTCYHRLSAEMLLYSAILARTNNDDFSKSFLERLKRSLEFTSDIMQPNNQIPQFGDNDNGRLIQFFGYSTAAVNDHCHLLALGGEFFNDDAIRHAGLGAEPEAIWTLGTFNSHNDVIKDQTVFKTYRDGGYYIVRNSLTKLVIRNGKINGYCGGGHAHCDQLSLTLNHFGTDILVDPGAYRYSSDFQARNDFRSVEYHNTIQVNNSPMHYYDRETFPGLWWMRDLAMAETQKAQFNNHKFEFEGSISSYKESDGCLVNRKITYNDRTLQLKILDCVSTSYKTPDDTSVYSRLLFGPELTCNVVNTSVAELTKNGKVIVRIELSNKQAELKVNNIWYSPRYGERESTQQLEICWQPEKTPALEVSLDLIPN